MRNKSKLVTKGVIFILLFVVLALLTFVVSAETTQPAFEFKFDRPIFKICYHLLDSKGNSVGGFGMFNPEDKIYYFKVPDNAKLLEGYFEHWCNYTFAEK